MCVRVACARSLDFERLRVAFFSAVPDDERRRALQPCRKFIDSIADQVLVIADDYSVLMANQALLEATGGSEEAVVGRRCHRISHGSDRPCDLEGEPCPLREVLATGRSTRVTHEHSGEGAETRTVQVVCSPLRDDDTGAVVGVIEVMRDITDQRNLEEALSRRNEELEREHRNRERFTSTVCHEVKNALNLVNLNAQAMAAEVPLDEVAHYADAITRQAKRLGTLVDDLRDASALETQRFSLRRRPCDLVELAHQAIQAHRLPGSSHDIRLRATATRIRGHWDAHRLAQVVENLLSNAFKFSPRGSTVLVEVRLEDGGVRLEVADDGCGIPGDGVERLFEPYVRAHHHVEGTGLGLFLSRGIVAAHGGEMGISSVEGEGTTVWFWLPLDEEASPPAG